MAAREIAVIHKMAVTKGSHNERQGQESRLVIFKNILEKRSDEKDKNNTGVGGGSCSWNNVIVITLPKANPC